MNDVQACWKTRKWPIRNGIYYADNTVTLLDVRMPWETSQKGVSVNVVRNQSVFEIQELKEGKLTHLAPLCQRAYVPVGKRVLVGEGGHGSEGFIALTHTDLNNLIWLAYFDCTNPFEEVSMEDEIIVAISNLEHVWRIPINEPEGLSVTLPEQE